MHINELIDKNAAAYGLWTMNEVTHFHVYNNVYQYQHKRLKM